MSGCTHLCDWQRQAMGKLRQDRQSTPRTPLVRLDLANSGGVDLFLKLESELPSGSLKHRVARSLFEKAICDGSIGPGTVIVEASSGSAAISEAYFARAIGVRFIAVVPPATAPGKLQAIRDLDGEIVFSERGQDLCRSAEKYAAIHGYYFMDQFANAERAGDFRSSENVIGETLEQLTEMDARPLRWLVVGAGTGGTGTLIARHLRYLGITGRSGLCLVDPEGSFYFRQVATGSNDSGGTNSDFIEGIGRKRASPSFMPRLIDQAISVPDAASIGAAHWLKEARGHWLGPSSGTALIGAMALASSMADRSERGSIVMLGCDVGERYSDTVFDKKWLKKHGIDVSSWWKICEGFARGEEFVPEGLACHPPLFHPMAAEGARRRNAMQVAR